MKQVVSRNKLRRIPALLLIAGLMISAPLTHAAETGRRTYQLPTGPLANSLQFITAHTGVAINYDAKLVGGLNAPELSGSLTVAEVLQRALQGSGLEAIASGNTYVIRRVQAAHAAAPSPEIVLLEAVMVQANSSAKQKPQRPPTAIERKKGSELEEQHIEDIQDLQYVVPGLFVQSTDSNDTQLSIRGVGDGGGQSSGDQNIGMPSSVAVFVDNVYFPRPGIIRSIVDIDYADVYKGPSGTIFGMNATGGAIDVHTNAPSFTPEASASLSYADRNTSKSAVNLSGPISDTVAYRFNILHAESEGSVKNLYDGNRVNGYERNGARTQFLLKPSNKLEFKLSGDYSNELATPTRVFEYIAPNSSFPSLSKKIGNQYVVGGRETIQDDVTTTSTEQVGLSAEANYQFDNGYKFRSVSAYREYHYSPVYNDELSVRIYSNSGTKVADQDIAQDFRLESPRGKWFDFVSGVSYFRQKQDTEAHTRYANTDIVTTYAGTGTKGLDIQRYGTLHDEMSSLYSSATFHATKQLDFQAGLRETYDERMARFVRRNKANFDSGEIREYKVLPSGNLSLKYRVSDDWSTYLSYGYGQKAGGINVSAGAAKAAGYDTLLLRPETTRNTELGIQGPLVKDILSLSADIFRTKVSDFQTQAYDPETASSYLMNAGTFRSQGVEAALGFTPLRNLNVNVSATINDARYTDYSHAICPDEVSSTTGYCDLTGHRVFNAPKRVFTISSRYSWVQGDYNPYLSGRYTYRSWTYNTVNDSEADRITGYGLAGFATGVKIKTSQGQWDASLWVNNAFNKLYYTRLIGSGAVTGYVGDPRTVGITVKFTY